MPLVETDTKTHTIHLQTGVIIHVRTTALFVSCTAQRGDVSFSWSMTRDETRELAAWFGLAAHNATILFDAFSEREPK